MLLMFLKPYIPLAHIEIFIKSKHIWVKEILQQVEYLHCTWPAEQNYSEKLDCTIFLKRLKIN